MIENVSVVDVIQTLVLPLLLLVLNDVRSMRTSLQRVTVKLARLETAVEIHLGVKVADDNEQGDV